jgi:hypothetical protein
MKQAQIAYRLTVVLLVTCCATTKAAKKLSPAEAIDKALASQTRIEFIEAPLCDVVEYLKDLHGINIVIDTEALDDVGIGSDSPVTLDLEHASLDTALTVILKQLDLNYAVQAEYLLITNAEEAEAKTTARVYNVRDALKSPEELQAYEDDRDELIELITYTVEPTTWCDVGGPGAIEAFRRSLVVSESWKTHRAIDTFLDDLRIALKTKPGELARTSSQLSAQMQSMLDETAPADFTDAPLRDVMDYFAAAFDVDIYIDTNALADVGIGSDTPITYRAKDVPLGVMLTRILRERDLTWTCQNDLIVITTPEEAESNLLIRFYNIADLATVEGGDVDDIAYHDYDTLIELTTSMIEVASWNDVGGPGCISPYRGLLVIAQTRTAHDQIERFYTGLRMKLAGKTPPWEKKQAALAKRLNKPITFSVQEAALEDVCEFLSDKMRVPIQIDRRGLDDYGIGSDTPISLDIKGVPIGRALDLMLNPIDLAWTTDNDDMVVVTNEDRACEELSCRLYPIADLLKKEGVSAPDPDELLDIITSVVAPDSWCIVGGPGEVEIFRNQLIVTQSTRVHEKIKRLLNELRGQS